MITVVIFVNGNPIFTRTAVRVCGIPGADKCLYNVDTGKKIEHNYNDGAVALAHKLLDTIDEKKLEEKDGPTRR
jgi:hypothetical protein